MRTARTLLLFTLVVAIAAPLLAADEKGKRKRKGKGRRKAQTAVQVPKEITLTPEQKKQVAALNKHYGKQFAAARKAVNDILSVEQKKARTTVVKANRAAKTRGKKAKEAIDAALKLTPEQKKTYGAAQKKMGALRREIQGKFAALLTDEQKAKLPKRKARKKKARKKKNKNDT